MKTTTTKRHRKSARPATPNCPTPGKIERLAIARRLATLADIHLQQGLHHAAELLAFRAESLREAGQ